MSFVGGNFENGEQIIIHSTDSTGQGLFLFNTNELSYFKNIEINNLSNPSRGRWNLFGILNFYESDVQIYNCVIKNNHSEDAINIIRSKFHIEKCLFENIYSDAIDLDFSSGLIFNSNFLNIKNDALDFSGSSSEIFDLSISNAGDKGISIGERSFLTVDNVNIINSNIGVACKDDSEALMKKINVSKCNIGIAVFQKKAEYGPAFIRGSNIMVNDTKNSYLVEKGSRITLNDKVIEGDKENIKEQIYGDQIIF